MMENKPTTDDQTQDPKKKKNTRTLIIVVLILAIISAAFIVYYNRNKGEPNTAEKLLGKDSLSQKSDSVSITKKQDSINTRSEDGYYEEGDPYGRYIYVGNGLILGETKINYGTSVYLDYARSNDNKKLVFLANPYENKKLPYYIINANDLIDEYTYERYTKNFSIPPYNSLPNAVKDIILDNNYSNGNNYSISQNADRVKSTICFGDFDGDGSKDVAVLLDNNEKQISRLLVICTNTVNQKPYIAFAENYNDKLQINSFKKGAKIIINGYSLEPSEIDGIILKGEDVKIAIVYNKALQKFKTYYQE